jgi:hypothetical protein
MMLFTFCSIGIIAQTKIIKANPLGLAFGIANFGLEFSERESQLHVFLYFILRSLMRRVLVLG